MHLVIEGKTNKNVEIRIDISIKTYILIKTNGPEIFVYNKKQNI